MRSTYLRSLLRKFTVHRYIQHHPLVLYADNEDPDQTAHSRSLISAIAVRV